MASNDLERRSWEQGNVAYFKVLSRKSSGENVENYKNLRIVDN
jgi:hypothetical protein